MAKKIIAISSIKGGVGKTTVAANLGSAIVRLYGKKVLIVDANFSAPNLGIHFGYMNVPITVQDVLDGKAKYQSAIYEHSEGIHVMPGLLRGKFLKKWTFSKLINKLKKHYDIILIDTSPILEELSQVIAVADELIFIATPDYPSLNTVLQLSNYVKRKITVKGVILNMVKNRSFELKEKDVNLVSELDLLGAIPYNIGVQKSVANFSPYCLKSTYSNVFRAYKRILPKILD
ncbi:AAA family ATPase [Candidatus Pacearchaeota archaeon]|nr:AAA family ATPase [Candidatus Pacearchaeota archaeon]